MNKNRTPQIIDAHSHSNFSPDSKTKLHELVAVAVSEGQSLQDAVWFATKAAAISVTKKGVVEAIPTRKEVDDLKEVEK